VCVCARTRSHARVRGLGRCLAPTACARGARVSRSRAPARAWATPGAAIAEAIAKGIPRSEIWVTTKLHERFYYLEEEAILGMVQEWMQELQVEYLDLVLLHQPKPMIPPFFHRCTNWTQCTASAWKSLAQAKAKGWVRNIGVSNFNIAQLKEVQAINAAPIAVNQFMLNPFSPAWAFDIAAFCKEQGIAVTAWAPLSGTVMQTKQATGEALVKEVAAAHSISPAQVCRRV
jgi:diketogulonate reductase-like aldo/keto reductase